MEPNFVSPVLSLAIREAAAIYMRTGIFKPAFVALIFAAALTAFGSPPEELKDLFEKRRYFELREKLAVSRKDNEKHLAFYRAVVENRFNRPERSIALLERFLKDPKKIADTRLVREAYTVLADSYVKTYQYRKAAAIYETILASYADGLKKDDAASYANVAKLWKALANTPPQSVRISAASAIQGKQEPVGLTIPVEVNGQPDHFIFDTGANLSTITESQAAKLKLDIVDASVDIGSITGNDVKAKLGVARELTIGNARLQNVVFIVFPDPALYIEQIKYQIHGILGFPAIEALGEVTWTRSREILVPASPRAMKHANLALDGLTPLIHGSYAGQNLTFALHTGARTSSLFPPFFDAFEKNITAAGKPYTETITGAGGSRQVKAYKLENVLIEFGGKSSLFKEVEVLTENTTDNSDYFYGNIGRDMIDQHQRMTINFQSMAVSFE